MNEASFQTRFDSSWASLQRLDHQLKLCNYFSKAAKINNDIKMLKAWLEAIRAAYREVESYINNRQRKSIDAKFLITDETVFNLYKRNKTENGYISKLNYNNFVKVTVLNHKLEMSVRRLAAAYGMLITKKKSMEDVMDNE